MKLLECGEPPTRPCLPRADARGRDAEEIADFPLERAQETPGPRVSPVGTNERRKRAKKRRVWHASTVFEEGTRVCKERPRNDDAIYIYI